MSIITERRARLAVATTIVCLALPGAAATSASASSSTATFIADGITAGSFPLRSSSAKKGLPTRGKKKGPSVISGGVFAFPLRSS